ncbi:hypothetical protein FTUN_1316 [Frigoriglobus tundricola]|uniref:Uncharacterized protein n=1 Tax=Frigoriglobus tundricola TaxID=2774151 RepID=A0A6M5YIE2_9BACT|nr:hypothetical protein FTUN_1316 [Frigoriglobus tundricola]
MWAHNGPRVLGEGRRAGTRTPTQKASAGHGKGYLIVPPDARELIPVHGTALRVRCPPSTVNVWRGRPPGSAASPFAVLARPAPPPGGSGGSGLPYNPTPAARGPARGRAPDRPDRKGSPGRTNGPPDASRYCKNPPGGGAQERAAGIRAQFLPGAGLGRLGGWDGALNLGIWGSERDIFR